MKYWIIALMILVSGCEYEDEARRDKSRGKVEISGRLDLFNRIKDGLICRWSLFKKWVSRYSFSDHSISLKQLIYTISVLMLVSCTHDTNDFELAPEDAHCYREYSSDAPPEVKHWWNSEEQVTYPVIEYNERVFRIRDRLINGIDLIEVIKIAEELYVRFTYQANDHWQTFAETEASMEGDCEDYAIYLYLSLCKAGIDSGKLGLVVLRNLSHGGLHAAVCIYPIPEEESFLVLNGTCLMWMDDMRVEWCPLWGCDLHTFWSYAY